MSSNLAQVLQHPAIRRGDGVAQHSHPTQSSGFAALDALLPHGGWPVGAVSELLLPQPGSGELALLLPLLAELTRRGQRVFLLKPPAVPYAPAWLAAGVQLQQLIWLDPHDEREVLWAAEQILREPGNTVLSWFSRAPADRHCRRLQLAAEQGRNLGFLLRPDSGYASSTPFGLRLGLAPVRGGIEVRVLKRRGPPVEAPVVLRRAEDVVVSPLSAAPAARRVRAGAATA
jgi:protein ImuA